MELPYYKINEVSELLQMPISKIIRYACSGKISINILTAKFTVYESFQELKHNLPYVSILEYDENQDDIDEALAKYEEIFQSDSVSLDYDVCKTDYIKLSEKCLRRYESGELDAKVSIEYVDANDNFFVHFNLRNKNFDIPAIQECELIILQDDLKNFQKSINENIYLTNDEVSVTKVDLQLVELEVVIEDEVDFQLCQLETINDIVLDIKEVKARKKLIPFQRYTNDSLRLICNICHKYNIQYLDELLGMDAWVKIVSKEYQDDTIKSVDQNYIYFVDSKIDKTDFLEKYRKRFK
jgi:hypothetical protein